MSTITVGDWTIIPEDSRTALLSHKDAPSLCVAIYTRGDCYFRHPKNTSSISAHTEPPDRKLTYEIVHKAADYLLNEIKNEQSN